MRTFKNFNQLFKNEAENKACKDDGKICYSFDGESETSEVKEKRALDTKKIKNGKSCAYGQCNTNYGGYSDYDDWGDDSYNYSQQKKDRSINQKRREQRKAKQNFQDTMFGWTPKQDSYDEY